VRRAAILCLLLLAGCGASVDGNIGAGDLASVAEPAPPVPQGGYHDDDRNEPSSFTLDYLRRTSEGAEDRAIVVAVQEAGFERGYQKAWAGDIGDGGASAGVALFLFHDDSRTHDVLGVVERQYRRSLGEELEDVDAAGLGDESWGGHTGGDDESTLYAWRSRNLVAVVYVGCFPGCDAEDHVGDIARSYADAVDDRIDSAGG